MVDRDIVKPHSFDGIQEYDNDLPRWWLAILWLSVVWSVFYIGWYHIEGAPLGPERLQLQIAAANEERLRNSTGPLEESLLRELSTNPERIAKGRELFSKVQCITCHGPEANGIMNGNPTPGANLRDVWWVYGSDMTTIMHTIAEGVIDRGMPAQKGFLSDDEIINLACYITDLGRRPASGKPHDPERETEQPVTW